GNFKFIYGDARLHNSLESVYKLTQSCDILSIDLGGGYHPDTVFKVFYLYSSALKPKYTIIRNRGLIDFVNSAKTYEDFKSYSGSIESQRESGIPPQIKQMEEFKLWSSKLDK
ncbi:MAG: SAM-dependent methyltransferase, partial [Methanobrevibacter sp.]|nr:SAM-dependent methyltransferase [Candidatus Methanoflexus mossambicus]